MKKKQVIVPHPLVGTELIVCRSLDRKSTYNIRTLARITAVSASGRQLTCLDLARGDTFRVGWRESLLPRKYRDSSSFKESKNPGWQLVGVYPDASVLGNKFQSDPRLFVQEATVPTVERAPDITLGDRCPEPGDLVRITRETVNYFDASAGPSWLRPLTAAACEPEELLLVEPGRLPTSHDPTTFTSVSAIVDTITELISVDKVSGVRRNGNRVECTSWGQLSGVVLSVERTSWRGWFERESMTAYFMRRPDLARDPAEFRRQDYWLANYKASFVD